MSKEDIPFGTINTLKVFKGNTTELARNLYHYRINLLEYYRIIGYHNAVGR
jgi:hypothetical protein